MTKIIDSLMTDKTELFFLVEYGTDEHIERRHLFKTKEEAKDFCKKELYAQYDRSSGYWLNEYVGYGAKIITLVLEPKSRAREDLRFTKQEVVND